MIFFQIFCILHFAHMCSMSSCFNSKCLASPVMWESEAAMCNAHALFSPFVVLYLAFSSRIVFHCPLCLENSPSLLHPPLGPTACSRTRSSLPHHYNLEDDAALYEPCHKLYVPDIAQLCKENQSEHEQTKGAL